MIRYAYSYTGNYNLNDGSDWANTILFDDYNKKLVVFGISEFDFTILSDDFKKDLTAKADRIGLSLKGAHDMYLEITNTVNALDKKYGTISSLIERITNLESNVDALKNDVSDLKNTDAEIGKLMSDGAADLATRIAEIK